MDELKINIGPIEESRTCDGAIFFIVTAFVNGEELPDALDVDEFFMSLSLLDDLAAAQKRITKTRRQVPPTAKRLPIFNCTCGGFGCGGYYVDVAATPDTLIWTSEFAHSSQLTAWDDTQAAVCLLLGKCTELSGRTCRSNL